jgi:hypothetical protein
LGLAVAAEGWHSPSQTACQSRRWEWRWLRRPSRCRVSRFTARDWPRCGRAA